MWSVVRVIILSNFVSVVLFGLRFIGTDKTQYWFMIWNLVLAWVPVFLALVLVKTLKKYSWKEPLPMLLTLLWVGFLPNSFYLMTDLIHLKSTGDIGILFDVVFFLSFIWNGLLAGLISLILVHRQLIKRRGTNFAGFVVGILIFLNSFALYLGRSLRWNTWDLLVSPTGLLFDISERILNPLLYPQSIITTLTFFVLIGSIYAVIWNFAQIFTKKVYK